MTFPPAVAAKLAHLATLAAIEAPERRNAYAVSATVDWKTIEEIREALAAAGFDWRAAVRERVKAMRERRGGRR